VLESAREVVRCLVTYNDWWQPTTGSVLAVGGARRDKQLGDGLRSGLVDSLDERMELSRRTQLLTERDRSLLFLYYVKQMHVDDVAKQLGMSRRQCFRRRAAAIDQIVAAGETRAA
jgi:DNA-directed RNA polymerase specialized sigma subunit